MKKIAKTLYLINSITCIFIGVLHTFAHYKDLITTAVQEQLDQPLIVMGIESNIWLLWQGMSLMMGLLLIIIGLLNLSIIMRIPKNEYPPISSSVILIVMLVCVIYAGLNFFGNMQIYGGAAGLVLQSICLVLSIRKA